MPSTRVALAAAVALCLVAPTAANADPISAFTLFGGTAVSLGATNNLSGLAGSNATVALSNGASNTLTLEGGGAVTTSGGASTINGNIITNSFVTIDNAGVVTGDIHSGGNVSLGANVTVQGSIRAAGFVSLDNGAKVLGNVDAGIAAGVAVHLNNTLSEVIGTVTHKAGTTITDPGLVSVGSNVIGAPALPTAYVATVIPAATVFASGGATNSIANFATLSLAPGSYLDVNWGSGAALQLLAGGTYFFRNWNGDQINKVWLPTTGNVSLYFTGNVSFNAGLQVQGFGGAALTPADAGRLYTETLGNFSLANGINTGISWLGTLFASGASSDIFFGSGSTLCGVAAARDRLTTDQRFTQNCDGGGSLNPLAPPTAVPEPASLALLGTGLIALVGAGIRRARR